MNRFLNVRIGVWSTAEASSLAGLKRPGRAYHLTVPFNASAGREWGWRWWLWAAGVAASAAFSWVAVIIVAFWNDPSCNGPATNANRNGAVEGIVLSLAVVSFPWILAAVLGPSHRLRLLAGWALGVSLLVGFGLTHLTVASWAAMGPGGFCM